MLVGHVGYKAFAKFEKSEVVEMKNVFKKAVATAVSAVTLAVGVVGMSASAYDDSVRLYKDAGAPSEDVRTSYSWNFTTSRTTMTMSVTNFSKTYDYSYVYLYASVGGDTVISDSVYGSSGSASASNLIIGKSAYASATLENPDGNLSANVRIVG